jgi:hypothetical protein
VSEAPPEAETEQPSLFHGIALILNSRPGLDMEEAKHKAAAVMEYLQEQGHYLPGAPPAAVILADARSFAERLIITTLALRIVNMLSQETLITPESKPARQWIDDYLEGRNHGPAGAPMLWPVKLPGMVSLLRKWGFAPTPTVPAYVTRDLTQLPNPQAQMQ